MDLKLDSSHDLVLNATGQLVWLGGDITEQESYARMIAQRIECRIKLVRGEWYLDQRQGTPWHEKIWRKGATASTVQRIIEQVISGTPGVKSAKSVTVTMDAAARTATITFQATSDMHTEVTSDMLDVPLIIEGIYD